MMTREDLEIEWHYRFEERLALLCGENRPTKEQLEIARREATEAVSKLKKEAK